MSDRLPGRPKGSTNHNSPFLMPWQPIKWLPVYDTMVALHCAGKTNKFIAEQTDYSAVQVGNILRSRKALDVQAEFTNKMRSSSADFASQVEAIRSKAIERVAAVILSEELAEGSPFRVAEFSASILKGLGSLNGDNANVTKTQNTIVIGESAVASLIEGLAKANDVRLLHPVIPDAVVEDVATKSTK